jgi:hypothetical protein
LPSWPAGQTVVFVNSSVTSPRTVHSRVATRLLGAPAAVDGRPVVEAHGTGSDDAAVAAECRTSVLAQASYIGTRSVCVVPVHSCSASRADYDARGRTLGARDKCRPMRNVPAAVAAGDSGRV